MSYQEKYLKYKNKYINLKNQRQYAQSGGANVEIKLIKADWCGHCQNFLPTWENLQNNYNNKYKFTTLDSEKDKSEINKLKINGFPTILINNKEYNGDRTEESIITFIEQNKH